MRNRFLLFAFVLFAGRLFAQDTLTVMQYNLLYYGEITSFCTQANNSLEMKDPHLRTILNHVKPDIFTVNEISRSPVIHQHLLDNVLNVGGVNYFMRAASSNYANSSIINMLYYDSRKLTLKKQRTAQMVTRDVDVYELYYKSNTLTSGDTTFIICVVAHLKAGNTVGEANTRKIMVDNTMTFLEPQYANENILFMGDFNFYSGTEPGFVSMLNWANPNMRFYDPINQVGGVYNNPMYASIHTQSTSVSGDCKAGGGMDDRFDFILISDEVRDGSKKIKYIANSYKAVGQDGLRYDGTINGPPQNISVSQAIADALFHFSDHLPVMLKLNINRVLNVNEDYNNALLAELLPNPSANHTNIVFYMPETGDIKIEVLDVSGRKHAVYNNFMTAGKQNFTLDLRSFTPGFYFVHLSTANSSQMLKLLKN